MYKKLGSILTLQIVSLLLIIGLLLFLYLPSLNHVPRSDQWAFLIDTIDSHTIWETFKNSYSYSRTRAIVPSDSSLFRPLLFFILSFEKGLFGNHFPWIQAVGILLHLIVVLLLFIILNQLRVIFKINVDSRKGSTFTILGILFISFFALNFSYIDIIIWSHLHGYLVFHIFTLLTFILILKYISSLPSPGQNTPSSKRWAILAFTWVFTLLGSFTYELGQFYAVLVGIFFLVLLKKTDLKHALFICLLFFTIPVIYQGANILDMYIHKGLFEQDPSASMIIDEALKFRTIEHSFRLLIFFIVHPFFPSLAKFSYSARTTITALNWDNFGLLALPSLLVFVSWTFLVILGMRELRKKVSRELNYFFIMLLFLYLGYFALIVLGRVNMRPNLNVISRNTYYHYFPVCYMIIFTFILIGRVLFNDRLNNNRFIRLAKYALFCSIPFVIYSSVLKISDVNTEFSKLSATFVPAIVTIQDFLDKNPKSKISFSLDHSNGLAVTQSIPFTTVLFRKSEDNKNPDYVVTVNNDSVNFIPTNEYRSRYNLKANDDIAPTLVKVGYPNHIFVFNGIYSEVPQKR